MRRRWRGAVMAVAALGGLGAVPAVGSGGPEPAPHYVDHHGGTAAELARLYRGRLGIVMTQSPFADALSRMAPAARPRRGARRRARRWRRLGSASPPATGGPTESMPGSTRAIRCRAREGQFYHLPTDRPGPDYTRIPNCFPDAFETAAATLRARVASHGARLAGGSRLGADSGCACSMRAAAKPPPSPRRWPTRRLGCGRTAPIRKRPSPSTTGAMPRPRSASRRSRATGPRPGSRRASIWRSARSTAKRSPVPAPSGSRSRAGPSPRSPRRPPPPTARAKPAR